MSKAIDDVIAERMRQIKKEGYSITHDDEHKDGSLALAASCYAVPNEHREIRKRIEIDYMNNDLLSVDYVPRHWPDKWSQADWKPKDCRSDLIRAAALLIAEIERIDRMTL